MINDRFGNKVEYYRPHHGAFDIEKYTRYSNGCVLWLDGDQGVYKASPSTPENLAQDGDSVIKWNSQAWKYDDFAYQLTLARRPILRKEQLNGHSFLSFTKEQLQMMVMQRADIYDIYTPSIFLVGKYYSGSASFCGKGSNDPSPSGSGTGGNSIIHRKLQVRCSAAGGGQTSYWCGSDAMGGNGAPNLNYLGWNINTIIGYRNNLTNICVNGVDYFNPYVINASHFNTSPFGVGSAFASFNTEACTCDLAELIILNYAAPDWLKQNIIKYLSDKWGIAVTNTVPSDVPERAANVDRPAL